MADSVIVVIESTECRTAIIEQYSDDFTHFHWRTAMKDQLPIRVLLADNHEMVRYALAGIIHTAPDIELVAEASNRVEAVQLFLLCRPQVVVLDLLLPLKDGMSTIREIKTYDPSVQIIVLTSVQDEQAVCSALQAGAIGYLLKDSPMRDIVDAIRAAAEGKPTLSPHALRALLTSRKTIEESSGFNLTNRELEVVSFMARGLNNPEIALYLSVSRSTIKSHISSILKKLSVTSRTEAVLLAVRHKLISVA